MKSAIFLLSVILAVTAMPTQAQISDLPHALNESGRLRMLSQRMAKAYLLKAMDVQPQKAQQQFESSSQMFEQNLKDLEQFSQQLESAGEIRLTLDIIGQEWHRYKNLLSSDNSKENTAQVLQLSDRTLEACEALVNQLELIAQRRSAHWVNLSGRQRMLSQRIAKFYNAISLSGDQPHYSEELKLAVAEFDSALSKLQQSPDNTHFVKHKLNKVATQWAFSKESFKLLEQGNTTPLVVAMTTENILKQMNDITALYQAIDLKKNPSAS